MTALPAPTRAARLVIDLDAIGRNYRHLCSLAPASAVSAVVKANAYGLGVGPIAQTLSESGCDTYFVATAVEGEHLRGCLGQADATIWVLNGFTPDDTEVFRSARLNPVLNSVQQVTDFSKSGLDTEIALHIDTGMNRLGVEMSEALALSGEGFRPDIIMSHLACSERPSDRMNGIQLARFTDIARAFPGARQSLANTGGIYLGEDFQFDLARPGIGLYGATAYPGQKHGLLSAAQLEAPVIQLHALQPGDTVGYGASFTADRTMLAATVAAGYADGLPRALSNTGWARLGGVKTPILGKVSMDLIVLDVSEAENAARSGEPACFFGPDLDALAITAGTLPYELLTGIGAGVERVAR